MTSCYGIGTPEVKKIEEIIYANRLEIKRLLTGKKGDEFAVCGFDCNKALLRGDPLFDQYFDANARIYVLREVNKGLKILLKKRVTKPRDEPELCARRQKLMKDVEYAAHMWQNALRNGYSDINILHKAYEDAKRKAEIFEKKFGALKCDNSMLQSINEKRKRLYRRFKKTYDEMTRLMEKGETRSRRMMEVSKAYREAKKAYEDFVEMYGE
jgi:hypothetical protein